MDLDDLQIFVDVADAGGVSAAARRLNVSKSIVSRRLLRLENALGVQLLTRTTRGAALTEAGLTFREHAARVCSEIESAREAISPSGELRGRLRIAAPLSWGASYLAPILAEFAHRHRLLHVHTSYRDHLVDLVAEGFDCAVRIGSLPDSNLIARKIAPIHGKLVASPDYVRNHGAPETPDELAAHEILIQNGQAWHFLFGDELIAFRPQGRFKADSCTALAAAAVAGLGIAQLPECLIEEHLEAAALVPIMPRYPLAPGGIYVVRPPGQHPLRKVRVLSDFLIARFG